MADAPPSGRVRTAVLGAGPVAAGAIHVAVRYCFGVLFGFVTYRGLAAEVPWLLYGAYLLTLVALATLALVRRGRDGAVLGAGLLVLAAEPLVSGLVYGDGCDVGTEVGGSLLPQVTTNGLAVVLGSWGGACTASIHVPLVTLGVLCVGLGLRGVRGTD